MAWVAERKDVLSAAFWLLALHAWVSFSQSRRPALYAAVVALTCCGLASKPMVVTLPLTLLLFDVWPLGRLGKLRDLRPALREKLPLFALSAAVAVVALAVQRAGGSLAPGLVAFPERLANAFVSIVWYMAKTLWPSGLAVFYPHPDLPGGTPWSPWEIVVAVVLVALVTAGACGSHRRWLAVGWLWFVGTMLPVLGLVQVGEQARADRYTYVPLIGLFIVAVWAVAGLTERYRVPRSLRVGVAVLVLAILGLFSARQLAYWRNSEALFRRALAVGPASPAMLDQLGTVLLQEGQVDAAIEQYERALAIEPLHPRAWNNLGNALTLAGRLDEAIASYRHSLRIRPGAPSTLNNLGAALTRLGRPAEALDPLWQARDAEPDNAAVQRNLGHALAALGRDEEAATHYGEALRLNPADEVSRERLKRLRTAGPG